MVKLQIGEVFEIPAGMRVRHSQANELMTIETPVVVVVESAWPIVAGLGGSNHFEDGYMIAARALNVDGSYFQEGALLILAQSGDFRPEFILPDKPKIVLRRMLRQFIPIADA